MALIKKKPTGPQIQNYGYEITRDAKMPATMAALKDIWKIVKPHNWLIIHGVEYYPAQDDDVFWPGLWRELKKFPDIEIKQYFTYWEKKEKFWVAIFERQPSPILLGDSEEGGVVTIVAPKGLG